MAEAVMEQQGNNAAVEIARRRSIIESRERAQGADQAHLANIGKTDKNRLAQIHPTRMRLAEFDRQEWIVNAESSHTIDDVLKPEYWSHMAQQMNAYDHIEVRAEDGTWMAELIVVQPDRSWVKVVLKAKYEFRTRDDLPDAEPLHKVEFKGPQHRFTVIRLSDSQMVRDGFKTKEEAESWMREHERVITA